MSSLLGWNDYEAALVERAVNGEPLTVEEERQVIKLGRRAHRRKAEIQARTERVASAMSKRDRARAITALGVYLAAVDGLLDVTARLEEHHRGT